MPKICDRSPCDELMKALGVYIFGTAEGGALGSFVLKYQDAGEQRQIEVSYCPFCGTRLEEINATVLRRYTARRNTNIIP